MKPFFSVIIPTLNEEKYLPVILSSLAKQTYRDSELIVVDACSKDRTYDVFCRYKNLMPSANFYLSNKKNVAYQRNLGGKKAKGKYLIFLDADVDVGRTFLEEIHVAAIKQKFSLATTWIASDSKETIDDLVILVGNIGMELAKGINRPFAGGFNTIVKKDIFTKIGGYREDLKISEDHELIMRADKKNIVLTILKEPKVTWSLRRFRTEGTLRVLRKYAQAYIYGLLKGPITQELFDYPMGGQAHVPKRNKKLNLIKIDKYIRNIEKLEKKVSNLFWEKNL